MPYQWPSSKITEKEMALLFKAKQKTGKPIVELIRQAIIKVYKEREDEKGNLAGDGELSI